MKKNLFATTLIATILICSCSKQQENDKGVFDRGLAALHRGQGQQALEIFKSIDALNPDSPYGSYGQALYFQKEGFIFEAIDAYEKILVKHSQFAPALMSYAELAMKTGRDELSIGLAERYVKAEGETGKSLSLRIETILRAGEIERAGKAVNEALAKIPDDPLVLLSSAKYYFHAGELNKSEELLNRAIGRIGQNVEGMVSAADYYSQRGLADSAADFLTKALKESKDDFYLKGDAAEILIGMKYFFDADQLLREISQISDSAHIRYCLEAKLFEKQGKLKKARKAYEPAIVRFPNFITVIRNLGIYKFKSFESMSAEAYLTTAFTTAEEKGYPPEELTNLALDHAEGLIYQNKGAKTSMMLASLVDSFPNDFRTNNDAAGILLIFAERDVATKILKQLARLSAGNSARLAKVGKVYEKADSLQTAENYYNDAIKLDKANIAAILGMISIFKSQNNPQQAIQFVNGLGGYILDIPEIASEMILLYQSTGDLSRAQELAEKQIALGSRDISRYEMALSLAEKGNNSQMAETLIKECLEKNPNDPSAYTLMGRYYFDKGNPVEAEKGVDKAMALDSKFVEAYLLKAELDTLQGKTDIASTTYENILKLDNECGPAHAGLAWLIAEKGGNYQVATNHAMFAVASESQNPMYYVTLGWTFYKAGRSGMARGNFEKALRFSPDNPVINYYAGLGYWKDGKPDKAKECFQKALANGLTGKLRTEAEATLKKL